MSLLEFKGDLGRVAKALDRIGDLLERLAGPETPIEGPGGPLAEVYGSRGTQGMGGNDPSESWGNWGPTKRRSYRDE